MKRFQSWNKGKRKAIMISSICENEPLLPHKLKQGLVWHIRCLGSAENMVVHITLSKTDKAWKINSIKTRPYAFLVRFMNRIYFRVGRAEEDVHTSLVHKSFSTLLTWLFR